MKVQLYGRSYYAKRNNNGYTFLYKNVLHYVLDIPSVSLTMMYDLHNNSIRS